MKKAYLVKLVNERLKTKSKEKIFLDKNLAYEYYLKIRNEIKYNSLEENTNNYYGDLEKENCDLVTSLYNENNYLMHTIHLIAYDLEIIEN